MKYNYLQQGDCLELMQGLPDKSIDLILCDLPYGMTDCKWDNIIPFDALWEQYKRIIKDNGAIVLFSVQPFTTKLISSNMKMFKYCWYWKKNAAVGFTYAKYQPMRQIEDICVFYKKAPTYNPQGIQKILGGKVRKKKFNTEKDLTIKSKYLNKEHIQKFTNFPKNILCFKKDSTRLHPTQKPVALLEYLIKTYTNEGAVVLDNCAGSGSTCIAAKNTKRRYIGFELDPYYYGLACKRLEEEQNEK